MSLQLKKSGSSNEQYGGKKKKKLDAPHVSSRLVGRQRTTVATEQIGITWRDMSSFVSPFLRQTSVLADVFSVPKEIFGLENMAEVLSYEVWETHLSDSEKNFLHKFLPEGTDADQVVQSLLMEENLHFGNSFSKWSASLFSGDLHPDSAICNIQQLKVHKKGYYSHLKKYHNGMMDCLVKWKGLWESCKSPETLQEMWRKGIIHPGSGRLPNTSENIKPVSVCMKRKVNENLVSNANDAGYIFSVKRSRRDHQFIKNTKHSVDGIKMKSLSSVLGDTNGCSVKSLLTLEEEEEKKVNEHWLQLACKDIPVANEHLRKEKILRVKWRNNLGEELAREQKMVDKKDNENDHVKLSAHEQSDNGKSNADIECLTAEQIEDVETQQKVESNLQGQQDKQMDIEESHRQTEDLQSQNDDCSIPFSECDNLEMSSVNSHVDDGDSGTNMTCSTSEQIDEGESQSQPEIYLQDERDDCSVPYSKCDDMEMHPGTNVLGGVLEEALKPQAIPFQAPQLVGRAVFVEDATGVRKSPFTNCHSLEKFPSLNIVRDARSILLNQEKIQANPKPASQMEPSPTRQLVGHTNFAEAADARRSVFSNGHSPENFFSHNSVQDVRFILSNQGKIQGISEPESFNVVGSIKQELNRSEPQYHMSSAKNSWMSISSQDSFCEPQNYIDSSASKIQNCVNTSAGDLSCGQHEQMNEYMTHVKDLMSGMVEDGVTNICSSTHTTYNQAPFFNPLGHAVSVGQNLFPHPQKMLNCPTNPGLGLLDSSNGLLQSALFPTHFQGQRELYSQRLNGESMSNKNAASKLSCYTGPSYLSQEHGQFATPVGGRLHGPDLFPGEHNIWSSVGPSGSIGQCWGNGRNGDHSMLSALTQYRQMPSSSPYNSISREQLMSQGNNYNGSLPGNGGTFASYSHQPSHFSNQEFTSVQPNMGIANFSWANFPDQSSGMQNSLGKPYMGTSNQ